MYLGDHLIGIALSSFQLPPSMDIDRVVHLLAESLHLELLLDQLFVKRVHIPLEPRNRLHLDLEALQLLHQLCYYLCKALLQDRLLLVLDFPLLEGALLDLDLLVEQLQLLVPPDELGPQDISFTDYHLVLLLKLGLLLGTLVDDELQLVDLVLQIPDLSLLHVNCLGELIILLLETVAHLSKAVHIDVLINQLCLLGCDIFLVLRDIMHRYSIPPLQFGQLFLLLCKTLGVLVPVAKYRLMEVLLLLEFGFGLQVLLLELGNEVIFELYLLQQVVVPTVGLGCLVSSLLLLFDEPGYLLVESNYLLLLDCLVPR